MSNCGCPENDPSLIEGPKGDAGTNGANATCQDGEDAKTRIDTSFGEGIFTESTTYTSIGYLLFPGTVNIPQAINNIYVIASTTSQARIRLVSSLGVIAESASFQGGIKRLLSLNSIDTSKFSTSFQQLELQAYTVGGRVEIFALSLYGI